MEDGTVIKSTGYLTSGELQVSKPEVSVCAIPAVFLAERLIYFMKSLDGL